MKTQEEGVSITNKNAGQGVTVAAFTKVVHMEPTRALGWPRECQHCKPNPSSVQVATRTLNAPENCVWHQSQLEGLE